MLQLLGQKDHQPHHSVAVFTPLFISVCSEHQRTLPCKEGSHSEPASLLRREYSPVFNPSTCPVSCSPHLRTGKAPRRDQSWEMMQLCCLSLSPRQYSPTTRCCTTGTGSGKVTSATSKLCPARPHPHPELPHLCFPLPALPGLQDHSQGLSLGAAAHGKVSQQIPDSPASRREDKDKWEPHQPAPDGHC